jgi:hypothetical protein
VQQTIPTPGGEAGYAVLARLITAYFAVNPPVDPRQVYSWHHRETKNRDGEPFPGPVSTDTATLRTQPRYLFSVTAVLDWYGKGVPDRKSNQHKTRWKGNGSAP